MEFSGTFTLEDVTSEEAWLSLSDPVVVKKALPGCQYLVHVDDPEDADFDELAASADGEEPPILPDADPEDVADRAFVEDGHYATRVQIGVGSVKPTFDTVVTIDRRDFPEMDASGSGSASDSSFEFESGMTLVEHDDEGTVDIDWRAETHVFGRIAQMGQRVINPVANRVVDRFFEQVQTQLSDVGDESSGVTGRIKELI
jgi:carbon monoxide dehydrogenase subunit G